MTSYAKSCVPHVESSNDDKTKARWIISAPALHLLEQVFKMEHFPSLHMRQRLAADLKVSARQVKTKAAIFQGGRGAVWGLMGRTRGCDGSVLDACACVTVGITSHSPPPHASLRCKCGSRTAGSATAT